MLKSRWLWVVLVAIVILLIAPLLAYRFGWYPQTLRGKFDRVQIGMTEEQLKGILGEPGEFSTQGWPGSVVAIEVWDLDNGEIRHGTFDSRSPLPNWAYRDPFGSGLLMWECDQARIRLEIDKRGRVCHKTWVVNRRPSFRQKLQQSIPLPW